MSASLSPTASCGHQIMFNLHPRREKNLDNFVCAPENNDLLSHLRGFARGAKHASSTPHKNTNMFIYSAPGQGRSHLLQGACLAAIEAGKQAAYLSLQQAIQHEPREVLRQASAATLLCLDDVHVVAQDPQWNEALYNDFNQRHANGDTIIASASQPPTKLPFCIEDLRSRFNLGLVCYLHPLDELHQKQLIQERVNTCGFNLEDDELQYIMVRTRRNTGMLMHFIEQLDKTSLSQKRRLNKRFIKQLAGW